MASVVQCAEYSAPVGVAVVQRRSCESCEVIVSYGVRATLRLSVAEAVDLVTELAAAVGGLEGKW